MTATELDEFNGVLLDGLTFCSKVYALFESIRDSADGPSRLRMRPSPVEKKLLEELLPICKYVQVSYRPGRYISVRWIDGSQSFDAEIVQRGAYVSQHYYPANGYIEVTCAMHPNEYLSRELLETKGGGFGLEGLSRLKNGDIESNPVGYTNKDFVHSFGAIILKQIAKKAQIEYPENTTLIIQCTLNTIYMQDEWKLLVELVTANLPPTRFREIYLYDNAGQQSHSIFSQQASKA